MEKSHSVRKPIFFYGKRKRAIIKSLPLYPLIFLPVLWYIVFCYIPMGGIVIAFKDYNPWLGLEGSPWYEDPFFQFKTFFKSPFFWTVFRNTFVVGSINTVITFVLIIIFALMFNEMRMGKYKKTMQSISYIPYFVSTVALVSILNMIFGYSNGLINNIIYSFGGDKIRFMTDAKYFIFMYVLLNLWKGMGWGTIIYTAAMASIDLQLYEAAEIEGAGRFSKIWHITLPQLSTTITIMAILAIPGFLGGDFETILLLQHGDNLRISNILATYIYEKGIGGTDPYSGGEYSLTTAIGLFQSIINMVLIFGANFVAKKVTENSLF